MHQLELPSNQKINSLISPLDIANLIYVLHEFELILCCYNVASSGCKYIWSG